MKKLFLITAMVLLVALTVIPSFAAGVTTKVDSKTANRGDKITINVSLAETTKVSSGGISVSYDSKVLELVSGKWNVSGALLTNFDTSKNKGAFALSDATSVKKDIFTLTFKVKSDAAFGDTKVKVDLTLLDGSNANIDVTNTQGTVTVECNHSYSSWASTGDSRHEHKCKYCDKVETASHKFDNNCDTKCNDCGYTRKTTHKYATKWSHNSEKHWYECSECHGTKDEAKHTPGPAATEQSPQICTVCERILKNTLEHVHVYDDKWESNADGHWQVCTSCKEKSVVSKHKYSDDCDTSCDTCKYERKIDHKYGEDFIVTEAGHCKECTNCKAKSDVVAHVYTNDCDESCNDCGFGRTVEHKYDSGKVKVEPTKEKNGEKVYTCTACKHEKLVELELFETIVTPPETTPEDTTIPGGTTTPDESAKPTAPQQTEKPGTGENSTNNSGLAIILLVVGLVAGGAIGAGVVLVMGKKKKA